MTHPTCLVVDCARVDARAREQLRHRALTLLRAHTEQVRLENGGPKLLFSPLSHGAPRNGQDASTHYPQRTPSRSPGKALKLLQTWTYLAPEGVYRSREFCELEPPGNTPANSIPA